MNCTKCKSEIPSDSKFCLNCGEKLKENTDTIVDTKNNSVTHLKRKETFKREGVAIGGIVVPTFFISIFCIILGFGGYISPLLLLSAVLLLAKTKSKFLTHNIVVILAIYGSQFVIETALTFLASIPAKLLAWLSNIAASNIDFVTTMGNISTGLENVFTVITNFIGICFFALYIICIISLCKSDKIKIPFISDFIKSVFLSSVSTVLSEDDKNAEDNNAKAEKTDSVDTSTKPEEKTTTKSDNIEEVATKTLSGIFNRALKTEKTKSSEPNFREVEKFESAIVSQISELNDIVANEQTSKAEAEASIDKIIPKEEITAPTNNETPQSPKDVVKEIVEEIIEETKTNNFVDEFEKHFEEDIKEMQNNSEVTENTDEIAENTENPENSENTTDTSDVPDVTTKTEDTDSSNITQNEPSAPPMPNETKTKSKNRRRRRNRSDKNKTENPV